MPSFESIPPAANLTAVRAAPPTLTGMADGLPRMITDIVRQVQSLAAAVPAAGQEIAQISELLKSVMLKAIPGGGAGGPAGGGADMLAQPRPTIP